MKITVNKAALAILILLQIASIVFASFYGGPMSYVLLYAVFLLIPVSAIYILFNHLFLSVYQEIEVHKLSKGENHSFRAVIENTGFLPIHEMSLLTYDDRCDLSEIRNGQQISLGSREKKELFSYISCRYAGAYYVGIEKVSFMDPFKIFAVTFNVPYSFRAIVSPRITDIADTSLDLENLIKSSGFKSNLQYEDIHGSDMRSFQNGDPLSSINWKVSARFSDLMVRLPDPMEKRTVSLILEASDIPESKWDTEFLKKRDFFLEFVVSAAWHFGQQGVPVRIFYPSGELKQSIVDSYESFMEFYNIIADGIFYSSENTLSELKSLTTEKRGAYGADTWILIREECRDQGDFCQVIE